MIVIATNSSRFSRNRSSSSLSSHGNHNSGADFLLEWGCCCYKFWITKVVLLLLLCCTWTKTTTTTKEAAVSVGVVAAAAAVAESVPLAETISLTEETFEKETSGRIVFLKFYVPWCGYCQELAPHWEQLVKEWTATTSTTAKSTMTASSTSSSSSSSSPSSSMLLIGEVNCQENEHFCANTMNIVGFPTLLYGDPSYNGIFLQRYNSVDKSYEALSSFVKETLLIQNNHNTATTSATNLVFCSPGNYQQHCHNEQLRQEYDKLWETSIDELKQQIQDKETSIQQAKQQFDIQYDAMMKEYNAQSEQHSLDVYRVKRNIRIMRDILRNQEREQQQ